MASRVIIGTVVRQPDLEPVGNKGRQVCNFVVQEEDTAGVGSKRVKAWDENAEYCYANLQTGMRVRLEVEEQVNTYTVEGQQKTSRQLIVQKVRIEPNLPSKDTMRELPRAAGQAPAY